MGSKDNMLRKFLMIAGFGSIIFGIVFFIVSMTTMYQLINKSEFIIAGGFWEKALLMAQTAQSSAVYVFEGMTLGGICLYLARQISKDNQQEASIGEADPGSNND